MKISVGSPTRLFLLELILVILIFSICTTICIGLFARSYSLTQASRNLNEAVLIAASCADSFNACQDLSNWTAFSNAIPVGLNSYWVFYDTQWNPISSDSAADTEAVYHLEVDWEERDFQQLATITIFDGDHIIYELETVKYVAPEEVAE